MAHPRHATAPLKEDVLLAINRVFRERLFCETDEELGDTCLRVAQELTGSKFGFIGTINSKGLFDTIAISNPGWDACNVPEGAARVSIVDMEIRGVDRATMRDGKSRIVNGEDAIRNHADHVEVPEGHPPVTAFLGVPFLEEDKVIGMIGLGNKEGGYTAADQEAIEALAVAMIEALRSRQTERALQEKSQHLGERVKELTCLYAVSGTLSHRNISENDALSRVVELLPPAWHYPEITCARIIAENREFTTANFEETPWKQAEEIVAGEKKVGVVEVFYLQEKPSLFEGPFLREERNLISAVAVNLGGFFERRQAEREVADLKKQMEFILGATRTGLDIIDGDFNLRYVDPEWQKTYGAPEGRKCYEYFADESEMCPGCGIPDALRTKQTMVTEEVLPKEDGRPIQVTTFPFQTAEGEWLVAEVNVDISERKKTEKKIIRAQKLSALGHLVGGIGHELNNMLLPIVSLTGMTIKGLPTESRDRARLEKVALAANNAGKMVQQLITYSRLNEPVRKHLRARPLMDGISALIRTSLPSTIDLRVSFDDIPDQIIADRDQIQTAVMNLADNAKDSMDGRVGAVELILEAVDLDAPQANPLYLRPGRHVHLRVRDTGCGMDPETMEKIFDPFFTTKEVGQGTGLGLSSTYGIVTQHDGAIRVDSKPGEGTVIDIFLPSASEDGT